MNIKFLKNVTLNLISKDGLITERSFAKNESVPGKVTRATPDGFREVLFDDGNETYIYCSTIDDGMGDRIYTIEYFDGNEWDSDVARLSDHRASQFPLRNQQGEVDARITNVCTIDEYRQYTGRDYDDSLSLGWEETRYTMEPTTITTEQKQEIQNLFANAKPLTRDNEFEKRHWDSYRLGMQRVMKYLGIPLDDQ